MRVYDPVGMEQAKQVLADVTYSMREDFGVELSHGAQFDSGQR